MRQVSRSAWQWERHWGIRLQSRAPPPSLLPPARPLPSPRWRIGNLHRVGNTHLAAARTHEFAPFAITHAIEVVDRAFTDACSGRSLPRAAACRRSGKVNRSRARVPCSAAVVFDRGQLRRRILAVIGPLGLVAMRDATDDDLFQYSSQWGRSAQARHRSARSRVSSANAGNATMVAAASDAAPGRDAARESCTVYATHTLPLHELMNSRRSRSLMRSRLCTERSQSVQCSVAPAGNALPTMGHGDSTTGTRAIRNLEACEGKTTPPAPALQRSAWQRTASWRSADAL